MKTSERRIKVSIGITAFNEATNIGRLLKSLVSQREDTFEVLEIIVISDGSTDGTSLEVRKVYDQRIRFIEKNERRGKMERLNEIFKTAKGELIVSIDADVLPENALTLSNLVKKYESGSVDFVSGRSKALPAKTFFEESVNVSRSVWDKLRYEVKDGMGVYSCNGKFYGVSRRLAREISFPKQLLADQGYIYFLCLKKKFKSAPAREAVVLFRSPSTTREHINQINRYNRENVIMKGIFGDIVDKEYAVPRSVLFRLKLGTFLKYPVHCTIVFLVNFYSKYMYRPKNDRRGQSWEVLPSTKEVI